MSIQKSTVGVDLVREDNVLPKKPKSGYTAAVGDVVARDTSIADGVDRAVDDEVLYGEVISINSGNGTLSIALYKDGVRQLFEYEGTAPTLGQKVDCTADRGTVIPTRDRVTADDTNGTGAVVGVDASSPGGTGTCVVEFP